MWGQDYTEGHGPALQSDVVGLRSLMISVGLPRYRYLLARIARDCLSPFDSLEGTSQARVCL